MYPFDSLQICIFDKFIGFLTAHCGGGGGNTDFIIRLFGGDTVNQFFFSASYFLCFCLQGHFFRLQNWTMQEKCTVCLYVQYVYMDIFVVIYFSEFLFLAKVAKINSSQKKMVYSSCTIFVTLPLRKHGGFNEYRYPQSMF